MEDLEPPAWMQEEIPWTEEDAAFYEAVQAPDEGEILYAGD